MKAEILKSNSSGESEARVRAALRGVKASVRGRTECPANGFGTRNTEDSNYIKAHASYEMQRRLCLSKKKCSLGLFSMGAMGCALWEKKNLWRLEVGVKLWLQVRPKKYHEGRKLTVDTNFLLFTTLRRSYHDCFNGSCLSILWPFVVITSLSEAQWRNPTHAPIPVFFPSSSNTMRIHASN